MAKFSSENQPERRSGGWFRKKIIDSLKRQGMNEDQFIDSLVEKSITDGGVFLTELLKRYSPIHKQTHEPITIEFPPNATPVQKADSVISAMASGDISPDVGQIFIDSISKSLGIEEIAELAKRLEKIEAILAEKTNA